MLNSVDDPRKDRELFTRLRRPGLGSMLLLALPINEPHACWCWGRSPSSGGCVQGTSVLDGREGRERVGSRRGRLGDIYAPQGRVQSWPMRRLIRDHAPCCRRPPATGKQCGPCADNSLREGGVRLREQGFCQPIASHKIRFRFLRGCVCNAS